MGKPVFLIGFMGVGKTTLGKKLAKKLSIPFYDTDIEIEHEMGMTVQEIFAEHGEAHFRLLEQKWLEGFFNTSAIVATGGGMPCDEKRLSLMKSLGTVVYLDRPVKELFNRLLNAKKSRPLLASMSDDEMLEYIQSKLKERSFYYNQADYILNRSQQDANFISTLLAHK